MMMGWLSQKDVTRMKTFMMTKDSFVPVSKGQVTYYEEQDSEIDYIYGHQGVKAFKHL